MKHSNLSQRHLVADKVDVNLYMLRATMMNRVSRHIYSTDVVTVDQSRRRQGHMKLLKKLTKPARLSHSMCDCSILSLCTRAGDCGLAFGRPRHQIVAEEDTVAGSRSSGIRTAGPIRIRVGCEAIHWSSANVKTSRQCALHIAQDPLEQRKMRLAGIMHEETHLLNSVGDVGSSQREVLKCTGETPVLRGILNRITICCRQLGSSVNGCGCRVTLGHASTLKKIHRILSLRQKETISRTGDRDPEEVMKISQICHGKLRV